MVTSGRLLQCATAALVVWAVWSSASVPRIDRDTFDTRAVELERTRTWRYGFVRNYRGELLVRTRLGAGAPPLGALAATDTIVSTMTRELHARQQRAAVQAVLYGCLWGLLFRGILGIRRMLRVNSTRRYRHAAP